MPRTSRNHRKIRTLLFALCIGTLGPTTTALGQSSTTLGTTPQGQPIAASGVLLSIREEANRLCVPITYGQFTESNVELETPDVSGLEAIVARLGLRGGSIRVSITRTPPILAAELGAAIPRTRPPLKVEVPAVIGIDSKTQIATLKGLPGRARNSLIEMGGDSFSLDAWEIDHWTAIGVTVDNATTTCRVGWFAPSAKTFFASGMANPIFGDPNSKIWKTTRWPTWSVRLPILPKGWYRLTTRVGLIGNANAKAGAKFRVK
jgi:hypothetical protein